MNMNGRQLLYLAFTLGTMVFGYLYLRYAYQVTDQMPFAQEVVLIILGTIITVLITALLLNKQTAVEIEKEQSIKFLDLKAKTYEHLLSLLESMSQLETFTQRQLTDLKFMTHRLAIVSSAEVLEEYERFLKVVSEISADMSFADDQHPLHLALSRLSLALRADLIGREKGHGRLSGKEVARLILSNSNLSHRLGRKS